MTLLFEISIIIFLIVINGFLAMSELAVVSSSRHRLAARAENGSTGARLALRLAENPGRFLSTVQIGITLVGILAGAYSGATLAPYPAELLAQIPLLAPYAQSISFGLVVVLVTYASLIIGELVPKQLALANPEGVASIIAPPMWLLARISSPAVWLLDRSSAVILKLFRLQAHEQAMTEDEIRAVLTESTAAGVLKPEEEKMIGAVMRFADRKVRTIMTPRMEVVWLDLNEPQEALVRKIKDTYHSRYPVCRGELNNLMGVVLAKDLLDHVLAGQPFEITKLVRAVEAVPDNAGALNVLEHLKRSPIHLAVVVDEYGTVEGIVTAADVLSSLVGGLVEHGEEWEPQAIQREDGSWLIDGDMSAAEAFHILGLKAGTETDHYTTLAGFVLHEYRSIPKASDSFIWNGLRFEVVDMDGRRIDKIMVSPQPPTTK
ncbi:hemolysin family protein [Telmatospirillum sp. J64-1]|uniref:hemolysin family protein n=1 Tax=Telmatospirillum sp. J64-1 TaxID=2502183 RepID=UPI00115D3390|nr:hemolysin family protein [Telmatospirillum sp. J64-1]